MNWISLTNKQDFETAINEGGLFAVFKHSTRCSISSMAKSRLEREWNFGTELPIYYLDLLIVFKNGKPIYSASHNGIDVSEILEKA